MSNNGGDPIAYFGLDCPAGGDFHICQESRERFIGCCDVDPCADGSGNCPSRSLHPAGFDTAKYSEILVQSCDSDSSDADWFTCTNGPFLGCCKSNPCDNEGTCSAGDLVAASLSDDADNAEIFLTSSSAGPSSTISTSMSSTSSAIATSTPASSQEDTSGSSGTPVAKIVGGTVGGVAGLILVVCFIFLYMRRRAADAREKQSALATDDQTTASNPPWSPYKDSYAGSPSIPQGAPSPAFPSPPLTNNGRTSEVSQMSSPTWDSRHTSYTASSPPMPSNYWTGGAGKQQQPQPTSLNPVSELDGSGLTQYYELDAGPVPSQEPQELHSGVK
ncbi:hypothetical protein GGR53DRAFT_198024 [Hypoxylon sp. FL1150]|nr:hypothetical protein GGR53DRAFT_198024 [Hypoxylon sp. FL1150]